MTPSYVICARALLWQNFLRLLLPTSRPWVYCCGMNSEVYQRYLTPEHARRVIAACRRLARPLSKPEDPKTGLCFNLSCESPLTRGAAMVLVEVAAKSWPRRGECRTSSRIYPIGGIEEYFNGAARGTMWSGKWGDRRRDLARHVAEELTKTFFPRKAARKAPRKSPRKESRAAGRTRGGRK